MYLAVDIGGTKTLLALFSGNGRLIESVRFETPAEYSDFLKKLEKTYKNFEHNGSKIEACVAGAPGRIDRERGVVLAFGNLAWENVPLTRDLKKITGVNTTIENDANLAGLSEALLIRHGYRKVLYVTISTGIGSVVVIDGKIDANYADMEVGHMVFEHEGKIQKWQEFASGHALYEKYGKKASEIKDSSDWYEISRNIALGLTNCLASLTPEVVVIGGGVGAHFEKYAEQLHEALMLYSSNLISVPPLRQALRAEEAVIYGCYEFARQVEKK